MSRIAEGVQSSAVSDVMVSNNARGREVGLTTRQLESDRCWNVEKMKYVCILRNYYELMTTMNIISFALLNRRVIELSQKLYDFLKSSVDCKSNKKNDTFKKREKERKRKRIM